MIDQAQDIYIRYIRPLKPAERARLLMLLAQDMANTLPMPQTPHSLLELEGLGADLWQGIDAQAYVQQLRSEWDAQP